MKESVNVAVRALRVASICAGAAGLDLGLRMAEPAARTVLYVEHEATACLQLVARMEDGSLDPAPLWTDLRTLDGRPWRGVVDCLIGGIPCQPHSVAGKRLGAADERDLWPDTARVIGECRPEWVFIENVPGLLNEVDCDLCLRCRLGGWGGGDSDYEVERLLLAHPEYRHVSEGIFRSGVDAAKLRGSHLPSEEGDGEVGCGLFMAYLRGYCGIVNREPAALLGA